VLFDLYHDYQPDPESMGPLRFYVDERLLVTGRLHPLMASDRLRRELLDGPAPATVPALFLRLLELTSANFRAVVANLGDWVDDLEDRLLAERLGAEPKRLGPQRRLMARLRRTLAANRQAIAIGPPELPGWLGPAEQAALLQQVARHDALVQDLELTQERARLLAEELAGHISRATNDNLYVLAIITAIFLPMTLITGLFGINVGGLPWLESHRGFFWVTLIMLISGVGTLVVLRWRRLY
jgi:zinc transporter